MPTSAKACAGSPSCRVRLGPTSLAQLCNQRQRLLGFFGIEPGQRVADMHDDIVSDRHVITMASEISLPMPAISIIARSSGRSSTTRPGLDVGLHLPNRPVCVAAGSESEARCREGRLEDRRKHLGHGLLDDPVQDRRGAGWLPDAPAGGSIALVRSARARPANGFGRRRESPRAERHCTPRLAFIPFHARHRLSRASTTLSKSGVTSLVGFQGSGARQPLRHLPRAGSSMLSRSPRLLLVFRC